MTSTSGPSSLPGADQGSEATETKRPARKRATRKQADTRDAPAAPTAPKAAKRASRSKADRATAAVEELVAGAQAEAPASVDGEPSAPLESVDQAVDLTAIVDVDAFDEAENTDDLPVLAADADSRPSTVVPSLSVLFQAPDASQATPTRRRRGARSGRAGRTGRRAGRGAGGGRRGARARRRRRRPGR